MTVRICHLWADALNWNGSQGNVMCLKKQLEWRGIPVEVAEVPVGGAVDFDAFDLVYIGAGKAWENHTLLRDAASKAQPLARYAAEGGTVLAVCEGFELLGRVISTPDGTECPGLSLLDMKTVYGNERLTGNAAADTPWGKVVYFENHAGRVYPDEGLLSLGRIIKGHGNNGTDGLAGVHKDTVFGIQAHGPLLPKNPALADEVLRTALFRRFPELVLGALEDTLEAAAYQTAAQRLE